MTRVSQTKMPQRRVLYKIQRNPLTEQNGKFLRPTQTPHAGASDHREVDSRSGFAAGDSTSPTTTAKLLHPAPPKRHWASPPGLWPFSVLRKLRKLALSRSTQEGRCHQAGIERTISVVLWTLESVSRPVMEPGSPSPIVLVRSRAHLRSAAACLRLPWATESYSLLCQPRRRAAGTDLAAKRQDGGAGPAVGRCPCDVRHPRHLQRQPGHRVSAVARSSGTWHKPFFAALGPHAVRHQRM